MIKVIKPRVLNILIFVFLFTYCEAGSDEIASSVLSVKGEIAIKFKKPDSISMNEITQKMSIACFLNDTITAYLNKPEFENFIQWNVPYIIYIEQSKTRLKAASVYPDNYPTYSEYLNIMQSFVNKYPELCSLVEIGQTVKGRKILALKISDHVATKEAEPEVLLHAAIHGNEPLGYYTLIRMADYLLEQYAADPLATTLVDNLEIWLCPLHNPDGMFAGGDNTIWGATRSNANNIDINRNFPDPHRGNTPDGYSRQPETQAMMEFAMQHHFVISVGFHTGAEVVNYPWDAPWNNLSTHPDNAWFQHVSASYIDTARFYGGSTYFTSINKKGYIKGYEWYPVYGGQQDYMLYFHGCREFTIEMYSAGMITPENELTTYWNRNRKALLGFMQEALNGVQGTVLENATKKPIAASIFVNKHDTLNSYIYSDTTYGRFSRMIAPGNYSCTVSATGYNSKTIEIKLDGWDKVIIDTIYLTPNKNSIQTTEPLLFRVYPQPCKDVLYCTLNLSGVPDATIFDSWGRCVKRVHVNSIEPIIINIQELKAGIYYLQVGNNKEKYCTRFMKSDK
jgi:hypothetical protein